jgi:hypothetical protein
MRVAPPERKLQASMLASAQWRAGGSRGLPAGPRGRARIANRLA